MRTPEAYEKDDIREFLDANGVWYFAPLTAGFGKSGVPDICGCHRGAFFGVEVKRPGKEPTAVQYRRMAEIQAAGGMAFWGTCEKVVPEIRAWLASFS